MESIFEICTAMALLLSPISVPGDSNRVRPASAVITRLSLRKIIYANLVANLVAYLTVSIQLWHESLAFSGSAD